MNENQTTQADVLAGAVVSVQADAKYTRAVILLSDHSRLSFCHRVDERWARAVGTTSAHDNPGLAEKILASIVLFRLNAKHLEIQFADGSRWEEPF